MTAKKVVPADDEAVVGSAVPTDVKVGDLPVATIGSAPPTAIPADVPSQDEAVEETGQYPV